jgi:hypothetical protein
MLIVPSYTTVSQGQLCFFHILRICIISMCQFFLLLHTWLQSVIPNFQVLYEDRGELGHNNNNEYNIPLKIKYIVSEKRN